MSDAVRRAQAGDESAFEVLYREHVDRVYAICLRMAGDPRRAEEWTQDTFVRAWEQLGSFRGTAAFPSWLHRVAVNVVLGARRAEGRRERRHDTAARLGASELEGAPVTRRSPGTRLDLERALATLPPGARTIFVLHDVEGYRHDEIADLTGLAVGTSKAQLHRARRLLREALDR